MRKYVWRKRDIKSGERKREFDDWEKIEEKERERELLGTFLIEAF